MEMGGAKVDPESSREAIVKPTNGKMSIRPQLFEEIGLGDSDEDQVKQIGALRFPGSNRPLSRWARVRPGAEPAVMLRLANTWKIPQPTVLISVVGADDHTADLQMSVKVEREFKKGLLEAVRTTSAWVLTGGCNKGVTKLVGRSLKNLDSAVVIGIAPWGFLHEHEHMARKGPGMIYQVTRREETKKTVRKGDLRADSTSPKSTSSPEAARAELDSNHTHFYFVDSPEVGMASVGTELATRAAFEAHICRPNDIDEVIAVPMVVVVVGGDITTLHSVLHALEAERPCVLVPESGGAPLYIYDQCFPDRPAVDYPRERLGPIGDEERKVRW